MWKGLFTVHLTSPSEWLRLHYRKTEMSEIKFPLYIQVITKLKKTTGKYEPGSYLEINKADAFNYAKTCAMMCRPTYLFLPIQLPDGSHLPVIDIDDRDNNNHEGLPVILNIIDHKLDAMVVQSSSKSYWVILDRACKGIEQAINRIPSYLEQVSDRRYTQCVRETQLFVLRAVPRDGFIPKIIYSNFQDSDAIEWAKHFKEWWECPEIRELADIQTLDAL